MQIQFLEKGLYDSNSYLVWDETSHEAVLIDAGVTETAVTEIIKSNSLNLLYIILTHNHFDHLYHVEKIKTSTGAKTAIHKDDSQGFIDSSLNGSASFAKPITFGTPDILLEDDSKISINNLTFEIINTPGHTPGSSCILVADKLFTGDTLFKGSIGRTDFINSSTKAIVNSIVNTLFKLPENIVVYPGHGPSTTIGYEKKCNEILKSFL